MSVTRPPLAARRTSCRCPNKLGHLLNGMKKDPGGQASEVLPHIASAQSEDCCRFGRHTTSALVCCTSWYGTRSRRYDACTAASR